MSRKNGKREKSESNVEKERKINFHSTPLCNSLEAGLGDGTDSSGGGRKGRRLLPDKLL